MTSLFSPPFVLSYATGDAPEANGFALLSRTHQGVTEMVGGELSFLTGEHRFLIVTYATADSMLDAVEAERKKLKKPANTTSLGSVAVANCPEAMAFMQALAEAYRTGETLSLAPAWRGAAQLLLNVVPPQPINAVRVLADAAAQSRYDW